MALYDKSARMMYAVGLSLVIHAVLIGLLVGTQVFSGDLPKDEPAETAEPAPKDVPEQGNAPVEADKPVRPVFPDEHEAAPVQKPVAQPKPAVQPKSVAKSDPLAGPEAVRPAAEKPKPAKSTPKPAAADGTDIYVVKKGESLSSIAKAHGCTLAELTRLNKATLKKNKSLFVGEKLKVPKK